MVRFEGIVVPLKVKAIFKRMAFTESCALQYSEWPNNALLWILNAASQSKCNLFKGAVP